MTASVTTLRADTARAAISQIDETTSHHKADVSVALHLNGSDHRGDSSGPPDSVIRPLLLAEATLHALAAAGYRDFTALEASLTAAAEAPIALVAVDDPLLTQPLVGTAVVTAGNTQLAFAKATLDAVNRRIDADL